MANRPFAVGDLVVTLNNGVGAIIEFDEYNKYIIVALASLTKWGSNERGYYDTNYGNNYSKDSQTDIVYFTRCKIKTIRTPRKGSKEARDICAMLLRQYIKFVKFYIFEGCGFERPYHNKEIKHYYDDWKSKHSIYLCYQKAKSMLK